MTNRTRIHRRQLLASAAASTVALTGSATLSAQPSSGGNDRALKLGLMSYNLAKGWDIDTIIKNCTETKFEHIELRTTHAHGVEVTLSRAQRQAVRKRFEDAGLKISLASAFSYHHPDPAELREHIEDTKEYTLLARDLGALGIRVFPNAIPAGVPEEQTLEQIGKALGEVGEFGHDHGVEIRVCVHGRGTNIVGKIKKMIDYSESPHVYINWNCDHNDTKGPGFEANFNSVKDRIRNIHMHELWDEQYPYRKFFRLLKQAGYQGYCDAEIPASCEPIRLMKYYRALFLAYQNAL
ncbi:MAG: TIM barrel protein [Phycisphaerales bacterium]|nr:MAG: TIM barrel protein [Phycisphaerales bacterium]